MTRRTALTRRNSMTKAGRGVLLALSVSAACGGRPFVRATVPMDHAFRVDATIAGQPVRVLLDTGCTGTSLPRDVADRLGLVLRSEPTATVTDSTGVEHGVDGMARLTDLRIGATTWSDFDAVCHAFDARVAIQGLIGMEVLGTGAWWFDVPARVVHMMPAADVDAVLAGRGHRVLARVPLGPDRWRPFVRVRLEARVEADLLVDTGADGTALPEHVVASLALPPGHELARQRAVAESAAMTAELVKQGIKGTVRVHPTDGSSTGVHGVAERRSVLHLRLLELGGQRFEDLVITDTRHEGILGRDVLGKMPWLLHGPRREMWLLAPK